MKMTRKAMRALTAVVASVFVPAGGADRWLVADQVRVNISDIRLASDWRYEGGFRSLPKAEEKPKVEADTAHLRNGDKISGVIEGICDGVLLIRSELLPEAMRMPLRNVRNVLFKDRESDARTEKASAILANGDSLSVALKGYDGQEVVAKTLFCDEIRVKRGHVAAIVFHRPPRVIYRADFEAGDLCGFKGFTGEWGVSAGKFGPLSGSSTNAAYLKLPQEGHVRYTWGVSTENRYAVNVGFLFFARVPDHNAPINAYSVQASGDRAHLYRTIQNNTQHFTSFSLLPKKSSRSFEVDYDSRTGIIRVKVDGQETIAGVFSPVIERGEYIVITAQAKDRLDYLIVEQVADPVFPTPEREGERNDCVFLANGDRMSGEIVLISDGEVRMKTGYSGEPLEVPQEEISSLRFGGATVEREERLPAISFRNGDRLSGEVIRLEGGSVQMRSPYLGDIEIDVNDVSSIVFPSEDALLEEGEAAAAGFSSRR